MLNILRNAKLKEFNLLKVINDIYVYCCVIEIVFPKELSWESHVVHKWFWENLTRAFLAELFIEKKFPHDIS